MATLRRSLRVHSGKKRLALRYARLLAIIDENISTYALSFTDIYAVYPSVTGVSAVAQYNIPAHSKPFRVVKAHFNLIRIGSPNGHLQAVVMQGVAIKAYSVPIPMINIPLAFTEVEFVFPYPYYVVSGVYSIGVIVVDGTNLAEGTNLIRIQWNNYQVFDGASTFFIYYINGAWYEIGVVDVIFKTYGIWGSS